MKQSFLIILVLIIIDSYSQNQNLKGVSIVKSFYTNRPTKKYITENVDSLFAAINSNEKLLPDSIVTYKNGKRNGPAMILIADGFKDDRIYKYGRIIYERLMDSDSQIKFLFPLDTAQLEKTVIKISGDKDYISRSGTDTITIVNKTLPPYNRGVAVSGAMVSYLDANSYKIRLITKNGKSQKTVIFRVQIFNSPMGKSTRPSKEEVFKIETK
jgi:hypothetical protein